jgi:DNA-directed RNA polymerase subunit beta
MAKNTKINKITNLVSRTDFSKLDISYFDQPNLLEIQKNSYNQFFSNGSEALKNIFSSIYPIATEKNQKFIVKFEGLNFKNQNGVKDAKGNVLTQERCIAEGETYAKSLFVKTVLINNETGEVIPLGQGKGKGKKASDGTDGELFANVPIMTDNGTFIINGVEKNVISQIVRAPGLYSLNKSKIKLSNKKKENKGQICELLPGKGALMNFFIKDGIIRVNIRNARHDAAPEFNVITMLKAFGMKVEDIIELFANNQFILNSVKDDCENKKTKGLNIKTILDDRMIRSFRGEIISGKNSAIQGGIFNRIRKLVREYVELETTNASENKINGILSQIVSE